MRRTLLLAAIALLVGTFASSNRAAERAIDLTGTWAFSVDLDNGGHGDPTFVFKQDKENLTGSYNGPLGQHEVTGTVKDDMAVFSFEFTYEGQTLKAIYKGTVESPTKMTGTVELGGGTTGKWTAAKKS